jgi:DNA-binding response OmpR family regulator
MKSRIMVVDDEALVRSSLEDILRLEGYDVLAVESGEAALSALQRENFDLILLDLKMPNLEGIDVLKAITRLSPDTKVILLTGHGSLESAIDALRLGAYDYLLKPVSSNEILSSVARGLAKRAEQQHRRMLLEQLDASLQRLKESEGYETAQISEIQTISLDNGVVVDLARREVWRGSVRISLTPTEGKLMKVLLDHRGQVLSHRELVLMVQGYDTTDWEAPEVLRPLVSRLRRKLAAFPKGEDWITNVRGTGYVFEFKAEENPF